MTLDLQAQAKEKWSASVDFHVSRSVASQPITARTLSIAAITTARVYETTASVIWGPVCHTRRFSR